MAKGYGRPPMGRKGGKGMGMGMPGLNMDMIKQAQKKQADRERTQAELQEKEYTATAGGGVVSATVDGKHTLKALTIDPEAVDPEDVEMLQDMVIAAVNEAVRAAFDDVGDVDLGAVQVNQGQHQIQQFSGGAYEGLPLQIFLLTGTFSNE